MKVGLFMLTVFSLFGISLAAEKPAVEGATPGQWTMDFDAARKVAAEKKLPLLLNFTGSDWCGWCKLMDKQVFSQEAWGAYAKDHLMLVWLDFPNDKSLVPEKYIARNKSLAAFFGVQGYPSYIVLDDDGKRQLGQLGADQESTPALFIAKLKEVLQDRPAEIGAFLKSLPEKSAKEYREAVQARDAARDELKALEDSYEKRSKALNRTIEEQEKKLKDVRLEAQLAKAPPASAAAYREKKARYDSVKAELDAWIATQPPNNEENMTKFKNWKSQLSGLEKEMRDLLSQ